MSSHTHTHTHTHTFKYIQTCIYLYIRQKFVYTHTFKYIQTCIYLYTRQKFVSAIKEVKDRAWQSNNAILSLDIENFQYLKFWSQSLSRTLIVRVPQEVSKSIFYVTVILIEHSDSLVLVCVHEYACTYRISKIFSMIWVKWQGKNKN